MRDDVLALLSQALSDREQRGILRELRTRQPGIDFYSNDYLGLARNNACHEMLLASLNDNPQWLRGGTGSRLVSGNSALTLSVEDFIAAEHRTERALLFPSGYMANMALFSCLPGRNDTVLLDEFVHRSVLDGCRLSFAGKMRFQHNDLDHLENRLAKSRGKCWIAVESLYSMEGDFAPLHEMVALAERYGASLIVDEAHAMGVFGYGLVCDAQLQERVCATVVTYGKAMGAHGAAILSRGTVMDYLVNFAAPFIYTTGLPDLFAATIRNNYTFLKANPHLRDDLQDRIRYFFSAGLPTLSGAASPVQAVPCPGMERLAAAKEMLEAQSLFTFAVRPPTVKSGSERLRVSLHTFNTKAEIQQLTDLLKAFHDTE
ncbi:MAG: aminotransferase class I/II-fold pyridoxal phosphate-dependent enzyme [Dyadobacter sp.]|uniref:aminotransferase class I/II-fold pyridoxal phosphate-dependent enzyme n=1 Tax=Dyadobacter sp. TaxID=1914288 RepID=UPI001B1165D6|nr:aminotransferase class I/II-fold pyridoxal phosphate-dependent enzyme [Dyadobacter sp.]MBO9611121.1 aminotransferase class I/II-fold pyridoxal phosphate-dependent enzyme [Dyadobacter sp.]